MSGPTKGGRVKSLEGGPLHHRSPPHAESFLPAIENFDLFGMSPAPPKQRGGIPRHIVTDENINKVKELMAMGKPQSAIAKALGVAVGTLGTYYFFLLNYRPGQAGRRPHEPTSHSRRRVLRLAAVGTRQAGIAAHLGITIPTLTKHYRNELEGGWRVTGRNAPQGENNHA